MCVFRESKMKYIDDDDGDKLSRYSWVKKKEDTESCTDHYIVTHTINALHHLK